MSTPSAPAHKLQPSDLDALPPWTDPAGLPPATSGGSPWTPVPLGDDGTLQVLLLLPGDWQSERTAPWLPRFATTASLALRVVSARHTARRAQALVGLTLEFSRRLGNATAPHLVHQLIVETSARAAHARLVSLTVQRPRDEATGCRGHVRLSMGSRRRRSHHARLGHRRQRVRFAAIAARA